MLTDSMKAEYFINILGVETRPDVSGDIFKNIKDIFRDIIIVCKNNPIIPNDCDDFLKRNSETLDEIEESLGKYNLEGIYKIIN